MALAGAAVQSNAATIQFGQFTQQSGTNQFKYTNGVPDTITATGGALATIPIFYKFQNPVLGYTRLITQNIDYAALLTINATTFTPVVGPIFNNDTQGFLTFTFTITPQVLVQNGTVFLPGDVILSGTATAPTATVLNATDGGNGATLSAVDALGFDTLTFTSSVYNLNQPTTQDVASFSFSNASAVLTNVGGNFPTFTASGTGTFSTAQAVPEPGTLSAVMGLAVSGSLFIGLRKRRHSA
jgi:hypothetical protein